MKVEGSCYCGAIEYEAQVQPGTTTVCHCADCQAQSGSAFRANIAASADGFRLIKGQPRTYTKTAASGNQRLLAFCEVCGSSLYACALENPQSYSLRIGTLKQRQELGTPQRQIWTRRRHDWVGLPDSVESFDGQP
ncbi:GFA family protein [Acidovorax sp. BLS4]|uniref:GFA family protein n=1 Tax=Acidovorax sp. BLS4 TaxID=3273430 RepID=UPI002942AE19|nr:GFA family protein [Paracidovorax avenae]WOI45058.1 GFA family protein [Paracidovorax avenae]